MDGRTYFPATLVENHPEISFGAYASHQTKINHASCGWQDNLYGWLLFPAMFSAVIAGYIYGKRKAASTPPLVLNETKIAEQEKPFIQQYDMVTVLFADIEDFSGITDSMPPEVLLEKLNSFFFYFDVIVDRYHIEKIKTMGDAYMCAGGLPQKNHTNPVEVVLAALDMQNHLKRLRRQNPDAWSIRIGIHTGPVVAGMLGYKKLSFDVWGHTVNVAARLEASCKAGEINISEDTYEKVKDFFDCEYQGELQNNGEKSYYVKGVKPEFLEKTNEESYTLNRDFHSNMQSLRLNT